VAKSCDVERRRGSFGEPQSELGLGHVASLLGAGAHGFYEGIGLGDVLEYYWQTPEDLAHYARACVDILVRSSPLERKSWKVLLPGASLTLSQHQKHSGKSQEVFDEELKTAAAKLTDEQKESTDSEASRGGAGEGQRSRVPRQRSGSGLIVCSKATTCRT
jgi:hypothetical protein